MSTNVEMKEENIAAKPEAAVSEKPQKSNSGMLKVLLQNNIRQYGMIIALIVITGLFQLLTGGILLKPLNVTNIVLQNSYILILAIGMLPVILTGDIDLSVGSVAAFVGAITAVLMVNHDFGFWATLLIGLLMGLMVGAWQGFWIAIVKIPAFIATLSSMLVFRGLTMVILDGRSIGPFSDSFRAMSSSFIPDFLSGESLHMTSIIIGVAICAVFIIIEILNRRAKKSYGFDILPSVFVLIKLVLVCGAVMALAVEFASYKGIPTLLVMLGVLFVIYTFITSNTVIGRRVYALGGNEKAAALSGINIKQLKFIIFCNMGVLSAVAGMVFAARLNAGTPKAGTNFELDAIAACFIGGASTKGGIGTIAGAMIGGLIMGVINNGMSIVGIAIDWQQAIKGLVLLLAVAFDIYTKSKER